MPFDGLLAECESQTGPRVFLFVEALKYAKDAFVEYRVYARAIVFDGKYQFPIPSLARNMNARWDCATVFYGISEEVLQNCGKHRGIPHHRRQRSMRNNSAPIVSLLVDCEKQDGFHVRP